MFVKIWKLEDCKAVSSIYTYNGISKLKVIQRFQVVECFSIVIYLYFFSNIFFIHIRLLTQPRTKDHFLQILSQGRNQIDHKIAWGQGRGPSSYVFIQVLSANISPFLHIEKNKLKNAAFFGLKYNTNCLVRSDWYRGR